MRFFLVLLTLILIIRTVSSQEALTEGNRILGGGVSFSFDETEGIGSRVIQLNENDFFSTGDVTEGIGYSFSPYYGRLYDDFKMVGVRLTIGGVHFEDTFEDENFESVFDLEYRSYGFGGFIRQYFSYSQKFGIFLQYGADVTYSADIEKMESTNVLSDGDIIVSRDEFERRSFGGSIYAEVGAYVFILDRLSIETRLANFFVSYTDEKLEVHDVNNDILREGNGNSTQVDFSLINQISFDQVFTINYYF